MYGVSLVKPLCYHMNQVPNCLGKHIPFRVFPVFDLGARVLQEMPCKNNISDTSRCCLQFALRIQLI